MASNTSHPVRSARRCIVRSAVSKFFFVTAVAIATSVALAFFGALQASPEVAGATPPAGTKAVSGQSFGYPIKPFNEEHPIRANARGAALLAGIALGRIGVDDLSRNVRIENSYVPDPANRAVYDDRYAEFRVLHKQTSRRTKRHGRAT